MHEPARLPAVRSIDDLKQQKRKQKNREQLTVDRLGSIRRLSHEMRDGAESIERLCDKYQSFLNDGEIAVGEILRREISREARALIAEGVSHVEQTCRKIVAGLWGEK